MEDLKLQMKKLKLERRGIKVSFTSHKKYVEEFDGQTDANQFVLKEKFIKFKSLYDNYCAVYGKLLRVAIDLMEEEECDAIELDNDEFCDLYLAVKYSYVKKLNKIAEGNDLESQDRDSCINQSLSDERKVEMYNSEENINRNTENINDELRHSQQSLNYNCQNDRVADIATMNSAKVVNFRLPKIPLPKFDGNKKNWLKFRDSFQRMIVTNNSISDIEKYFYLEGCLDEKSKSIISSVEFSNRGFQLAWNGLLKRFDNDRDIIEVQMQEFFNLKYVRAESSIDLQILLDESRKCISALEQLGEKLNDAVIVHNLKKKLDLESRKLWEYENKCNQKQSWDNLSVFIQRRIRVLESLSMHADNKTNTFAKHTKQNFGNNARNTRSFIVGTRNECKFCNQDHILTNCPVFIKKTPYQRYSYIRVNDLCLKCLKLGHKAHNCKIGNCKICNKGHNQLLHFESNSVTVGNNRLSNASEHADANEGVQAEPCASSNSRIVNIKEVQNKNVGSLSAHIAHSDEGQILLSTAVVLINDQFGKLHEGRALLDSGSMKNFITNEFVEKINLAKDQANASVSGLNNMKTHIKHCVKTIIRSRTSNFQCNLELMVVPTIANSLPMERFEVDNWEHLKGIELADPKFHIPAQVDLLLGAEVFHKIMVGEILESKPTLPEIANTAFGWVIGGKIGQNSYSFMATNSDNDVVEDDKIENLIKRFWEVDSYGSVMKLSKDERYCESHFEKTHTRDSSGRYCVELPFKSNVGDIGESLQTARRRFMYLEAKLIKNPELKKQYVLFMREYEQLGHMSMCAGEDNMNDQKGYFLPHHAVLKPESSTTKLRVVFDASSKTTSGLALNDVLYAGPVVQPELYVVMLRFRSFLYAITCDVTKMYRQISVKKDQCQYQKILWREEPHEILKQFELQTVTYGTTSAPYLATRVLQQIAIDEGNNYPKAKKAILENLYVDDFLVGAQTLDDALELQQQLIEIMKKAGMELRKWMSNDRQLLKNVASENIETRLETNRGIKTLGLCWDTTHDTFHFYTTINNINVELSKRGILSTIARIFDPLGFVTPCIVKAKLMIQKMWILRLGWDDSLPPELSREWLQIKAELPLLNELRFPRSIVLPNTIKMELHGFADASKQAYGACIYLLCVDDKNKVNVQLVCSKSRIAPLATQSIDRLELNAAVLLIRIMVKVAEALKFSGSSITCWLDSTIVLQWLKIQPFRLKDYVAFRVAEIQNVDLRVVWRHVDSKRNPADVLSRGATPNELLLIDSWFHGPKFLLDDVSTWPRNLIKEIKVPDLNNRTIALLQNSYSGDVFEMGNYSSYQRLINVVSYCFRFVHNSLTKKENRISGTLTVDETTGAEKWLIKLVQHECFNEDIEHMVKHGVPSTKGKLASLNPFLDKQSSLRVGGRLTKSSLSYDERHQYLLPHHHFTKLLVAHEHFVNFHCGVQQTLAIIRHKFWIVRGTSFVRQTIHNCMACYRTRPIRATQLMGDLPKHRIESCRPFHSVGLDFCGPFSVRYRNQRKVTYHKVYICIFICCTTKAVHLELVEDASSDAFIACLKRFFSRRGKSAHVWSDNGTNFVGAKNKIEEMFQVLKSSRTEIERFCTERATLWHFIPPRTPNFGGLWESGVKILKSHLKRIVGGTSLTLEAMYTMVAEIEGVMNSRPITPLSSDPNDLEPLTPGHFLTGTAINSVLEPNLTGIPDNRLTQWKLLSKFIQHFWKRFNQEYVLGLQQRNKNKFPEKNIEVNDLVLLVDENLPSTHWLLGRVVEALHGNDGYVRTVKIRTKNGVTTRGISKIAVLPIDQSTLSIR